MKKTFLLLLVAGGFGSFILHAQALNLDSVAELESYIQKHPRKRDVAFAKQKIALLQKINSLYAQMDDLKRRESYYYPKEDPEFLQLMEKQSSRDYAEILNTMINSGDPNMGLLKFVNTSECDIVMRIMGQEKFDLPIPKYGENLIVVPKGTYVLRGNVCRAKYNSTLTVSGNYTISLKHLKRGS